MKELVYGFLDRYVGNGFHISVTDEIEAMNDFKMAKVASLYSVDGSVTIMKLVYREGQEFPWIEYGQKIANILSEFFSISVIASHQHVQWWFRDKYNLKTIVDIDKFVKYKWERERLGL